MITPTRAPALLSMVLVLSLAGCAAEPSAAPTPTNSAPPATTAPAPSTPESTSTPTPTAVAPAIRPALTDLIVTPDGIGSLLVGEPVPSASAEVALATWDPAYCYPGAEATGAPFTGAWAANYPDVPMVGGGSIDPFSLVTADGLEGGAISSITAWGSELATETGVSPGDGRAELEAAYPAFVNVTSTELSDIYVIGGEGASELWFEVTKADPALADYWPVDAVDRVFSIRVVPTGYEPVSFIGRDGNGPCAV
jgi:hypothetical protein